MRQLRSGILLPQIVIGAFGGREVNTLQFNRDSELAEVKSLMLAAMNRSSTRPTPTVSTTRRYSKGESHTTPCTRDLATLKGTPRAILID